MVFLYFIVYIHLVFSSLFPNIFPPKKSLGKMDIPAMKKAGLTPQMMGLHLAFVFEYAFNKVQKRNLAYNFGAFGVCFTYIFGRFDILQYNIEADKDSQP